MSKKKWLLLIIVLTGVSYLVISKVVPEVGMGIDAAVGPALSGLGTGIYAAINQSPVWQQWDIWISGLVFSIITGLIFWQGHNAYNKFRGTMVKSAVKEAGYQVTPTAQPMVIAQAPSTPAAPTPTQVVPPPTIPPPETKQET